MPKKKNSGPTPVEAITHENKRANLPTADAHEFVTPEVEAPRKARYPRDPSLDPQLVWRGKDEQDSQDLEVDAPPIYIQEKIDPRVLIENLRKTAKEGEREPELTLFDDFDGLAGLDDIEYYQHAANWSNRMILGDSLQVMTSLAEREALRGQVQMVYIDPPYGIKFGSNWQMRVSSRSVRDGSLDDATREVEQIRAFRDTWELGIHSYLAHLRDRLVAARDLLTESGSVFVQIGEDNLHLVRGLLDEAFGSENFVAMIAVTKTAGGLESTSRIPTRLDYVVWYARQIDELKYRQLFEERDDPLASGFDQLELPDGSRRRMTKEERRSGVPPTWRRFRSDSLTKPGPGSKYEIEFKGRTFDSGRRWWGSPKDTLERLIELGRVDVFGNTLRYIRYHDDFPYRPLGNLWDGLAGASNPVYVVQTNREIVQRCLLMTTDPGDLVVDPTCGSGTTARVAEEWGRRWITIDTSRVALAVARQRLMASAYPYYTLLDSSEGIKAAAESQAGVSSEVPTQGDIRRGFVYRRAIRVQPAALAANPEVEPGMSYEEVHAAMQRFTDSVALVDQPMIDSGRLRVSGPFTVESMSPHRSDGTFDDVAAGEGDVDHFVATILDNLLAAGIQNGRTSERLSLESIDVSPGPYLNATATVREDSAEGLRTVGISIGPQYGTVGPQFIKDAAREAIRMGDVDLLCVLGFAFDPAAVGTLDESVVASDEGFDVAAERKLGRVPVLIVRMNADLVMGKELKKTGSANLFTVFGEPDIEVAHADKDQLVLHLRGVDVYDPTTGELRSNSTDQVALWMIDTDYDEESFFVRHCYFTGGLDPYKRLKRALKADIDEEAWATLYRTESRPFPRPDTGKIAVKVINDYGDEVMKIIDV